MPKNSSPGVPVILLKTQDIVFEQLCIFMHVLYIINTQCFYYVCPYSGFVFIKYRNFEKKPSYCCKNIRFSENDACHLSDSLRKLLML